MSAVLKKQPHPALVPFVKAYWFLDLAKGNPIPMSIAPIPEQALYFYPRTLPIPLLADGRSIKSPNNMITGQAVSRSTILVPDQYLMFKIVFQTGGFYRLFGMPMTLFADSFEESILVLGNPMRQLREQIANAGGFDEMVRMSEAFLLTKAARHKIEKHPIDAVLQQANLYQFSVDQLARDACLSTRQFERKFLERTGVSPKLYQRIVRFNQAMNSRKQRPSQSWLTITHDSGYFDQMHLLRDFRQFTGEIPSGFDFEHAIIY